MLEVEPTGRRKVAKMAPKPFASTSSQAFARWLHHLYALVEMPSAVGILFCRAMAC